MLSELFTLLKSVNQSQYFAIEMGSSNWLAAGFQKVELGEQQGKTTTIRELGNPLPIQLYDGIENQQPLTLTRGLDLYTRLRTWWHNTKYWQPGDDSPYRNIDIIQFKIARGQLIESDRWHLDGALPLSYSAPSFDAQKTMNSIESFTIIYKTLRPAYDFSAILG